MKHLLLILSLLGSPAGLRAQETFTNPLLPSGADPWSIYHEGYYYYTHTTQNNITIWKTKSLANLKDAENKVVWTPPPNTMYSKELWAPELHFIDNKWYVYFAADDGRNENHRLYVLENTSADPLQGKWIFKGKLKTPEDKWSIDGTVFPHNGDRYLLWSGWKGDVNGEQDIFIAKMKNPWKVKGKRSLISAPYYAWEKYGDLNDPNNPPHVDVNEGPQILRRDNKLILIFSASGCWTDNYTLGMSIASDTADLLDPDSWKKHPEPVFSQSPENGVYAPGHNSFFISPDGSENWILYHANSEPGQGCGRHRSPRAQPFSWSENGTPEFGKPVPAGKEIPVPSSNR